MNNVSLIGRLTKALILYKNNIQHDHEIVLTADNKALILYKNNIQLYVGLNDKDTKQALILYKNNIQQHFFAIYVVFYYKKGYKHFKIQ